MMNIFWVMGFLILQLRVKNVRNKIFIGKSTSTHLLSLMSLRSSKSGSEIENIMWVEEQNESCLFDDTAPVLPVGLHSLCNLSALTFTDKPVENGINGTTAKQFLFNIQILFTTIGIKGELIKAFSQCSDHAPLVQSLPNVTFPAHSKEWPRWFMVLFWSSHSFHPW